jgi:hypothetical protein
MENNDVIAMVRHNRELHPGGKKVYLVDQAAFDDQEQRIAAAIRQRDEAHAAMLEMSYKLRLNRLALAAALTATATLGWLIGLMM